MLDEPGFRIQVMIFQVAKLNPKPVGHDASVLLRTSVQYHWQVHGALAVSAAGCAQSHQPVPGNP